jgi:hypothetical protein
MNRARVGEVLAAVGGRRPERSGMLLFTALPLFVLMPLSVYLRVISTSVPWSAEILLDARGARRPIVSTTACSKPFQTFSPMPTLTNALRADQPEMRGSCSAFAIHEDDWAGRVNWIPIYVKTPR